VVHTAERRGPAHARNLGAQTARGDVLLFLDADVRAHQDTLERIAVRFRSDSELAAVIGSYDDEPPEPGFFSQYRNLQHHYVHQQAGGVVATFWTGCGAIRPDVYAAMGGLDERYVRPSIEDIDLGYRMAAAGYRIELDPQILVTHFKRWTFGSIVSTDVFQRGIPWTKLMLQHRNLPNHLNVSRSQRASVALVWLALIGAMIGTAFSIVPLLAAILLNIPFYEFLHKRRGLWFALRSIPMHLLYHFYNGISFAGGASSFVWERLL
jgi:GT2 family glycosyltransferase